MLKKYFLISQKESEHPFDGDALYSFNDLLHVLASH